MSNEEKKIIQISEKAKEFYEFIAGILGQDEGDLLEDEFETLILPGGTCKVRLKKSAITEENKAKFIEYMKLIKGIEKGLSYIQMANVEPFYMDSYQAVAVQGVGRAFGVWQLIPVDLPEEAHKPFMAADTIGFLPANTGLKV